MSQESKLQIEKEFKKVLELVAPLREILAELKEKEKVLELSTTTEAISLQEAERLESNYIAKVTNNIRDLKPPDVFKVSKWSKIKIEESKVTAVAERRNKYLRKVPFAIFEVRVMSHYKRLIQSESFKDTAYLEEIMPIIDEIENKAKEVKYVAVLASAIGWSEKAIERLKNISSYASYVLVDLKNKEYYFNPTDVDLTQFEFYFNPK
ncbi:MAG: hypothetical protein ACE5J9_04395 [Methanosarcinales archaeon]